MLWWVELEYAIMHAVRWVELEYACCGGWSLSMHAEVGGA